METSLKNGWQKFGLVACLSLFGMAIISGIWYCRLFYIDGLFLPITVLVKAIIFVLLPVFFATLIGTRLIKETQWRKRMVIYAFYIVLTYYFLVLLCLLFAGGRADYDYSQNTANVIPFSKLISVTSKQDIYNNRIDVIIGYAKNAILFVPFGVLFPHLYKKPMKIGAFLAITSALLLVFEVLQSVTKRGFFDVDDCIFNLFGALCGYGIKKLKFFKNIVQFMINSKL